MPDQTFYTRQAAITKANAVKALYALAKLRFTKAPFVPNPGSTKDDLIAGEADFDGYTAGGYAITAYTGPNNNQGGGQILQSPLIPVAWGPAGDPPVGNSITGFWVETAAGLVVIVGSYDPVRTLMVAGDAFQWIAQDIEGLTAPASNPA